MKIIWFNIVNLVKMRLCETSVARLVSTESTSMESHLEALRQLKEKRQHVDGLLHELKEAGEHGWEQVRHGIDAAIDEFKHAIDVAREKLHSEK